MGDVAEQVLTWTRAGLPVTIARIVETRGVSSRERGQLIALTPGEPLTSRLLDGAGDRALIGLANGDRRIAEIAVSDADAEVAGLSCGGVVRVLLHPATDVPEDTWASLAAREAVCLATVVDGDRVATTTAYTRATIRDAARDVARLFARGVNDTALLEGCAVTTLWPVPRMLIVGDGSITDALIATAGLLGWQAGTDDVGGLASGDAVVVLSHDLDISGVALQAALGSDVGYVGALGSRHTQAARAEWLTAHGVDPGDVARIHGPAGLDIGAQSAAEIALAICAEIVAERADASGGPLRDRPGPVHA